jgi:hypothetical protein
MWPNPTDDDLRLLDGFLSPSNVQNFSLVNQDNKQQNNNSSQLIITHDDKQLIGPLGSNL